MDAILRGKAGICAGILSFLDDPSPATVALSGRFSTEQKTIHNARTLFFSEWKPALFHAIAATSPWRVLNLYCNDRALVLRILRSRWRTPHPEPSVDLLHRDMFYDAEVMRAAADRLDPIDLAATMEIWDSPLLDDTALIYAMMDRDPRAVIYASRRLRGLPSTFLHIRTPYTSRILSHAPYAIMSNPQVMLHIARLAPHELVPGDPPLSPVHRQEILMAAIEGSSQWSRSMSSRGTITFLLHHFAMEEDWTDPDFVALVIRRLEGAPSSALAWLLDVHMMLWEAMPELCYAALRVLAAGVEADGDTIHLVQHFVTVHLPFAILDDPVAMRLACALDHRLYGFCGETAAEDLGVISVALVEMHAQTSDDAASAAVRERLASLLEFRRAATALLVDASWDPN